MEIDTINKFMVAGNSKGITLLNPPLRGQVISNQDALLLAAYLVAMAEENNGDFQKVLDAVQNT